MLKQLRRSELVGAALWQEHWRQFDELRFDAEALRWDGFLDLVDDRLRAGRILEAGCGPGRYLLYMRARGADAAGVDLVPDALAVLKRCDPGAPVSVADLARLPFADGTFATILCLGVLEHFEGGAAAVVDELVRVLSGGGVLIVTVPYQNAMKHWRALCSGTNVVPAAAETPPGWRFYQYCYRRQELRALLERAGLTVVDERRTGVLFTFANACTNRARHSARTAASGLEHGPAAIMPRYRGALKRLVKEAAYRAQRGLPDVVFAHMALAVARKGPARWTPEQRTR